VSLLVALTLGATVLTAAVTGVARANDANGCPDASTRGDAQREVTGFHFPDGHTHSLALLVFWIENTMVTFEPVRSVVLDNSQGSVAQTASFENTQSTTFSVTQSVATGVELTLVKDVLKSTVNASIAQTLTTQTGQSASITLTAPAFRTVFAEYGLDLLRVTWTVDIYQKDRKCWYHGSFRHVVSDRVPTTTERWRVFGP
jgi:hypothetical protein